MLAIVAARIRVLSTLRYMAMRVVTIADVATAVRKPSTVLNPLRPAPR